jgi:cytochrome b6-f complex iron-sulfur subunit
VAAPTEEPLQDAEASPEAGTPAGRGVSRRGILSTLGLAWTMFTAAGAATLGAMVRFLFPNVLYEPPQEFKAGYPQDFAVGKVDERFKKSYGVWIVREPQGFYALSTICTHLGCTPNWLASEEKFKCPCHGSGFVKSGVNIEGPAPRPLERYRIGLAEDGQILVDKTETFQEEKGQWEHEGAYLYYS